ncbi:MAG: hypothetical protein ABI192_16205 [Bradyrhizobium sp.]
MHIVAVELDVEGFAARSAAACLALRRSFEATGFARAVRVGDVTCFGGLADFEDPLNTSDSQPASLASIGNSTRAAIAATTVQRRRQPPKPAFANILPDDGNSHLTQSDSLPAQQRQHTLLTSSRRNGFLPLRRDDVEGTRINFRRPIH